MSYINQTVTVNAFYFAGSQKLKTFPRQIELGHERLTFKDGIQYLVQQGERAIKFFDMSDGTQNYKLRLDGQTWTLIGTH
jgi:hypothetical protein